GDEVRENLFKEVSSLYADLDGGTTPLSFFFPYAPIPSHRRRDAARQKMSEIFSSVIESRRASGKRANDILDTFMYSCYRDTPGVNIPNDHIVGLLIALLFAGQHTSSLTLAWCVIELALQAPEMIENIIKEQEEVLGDAGNDNLTFDNLQKMPILHACIKETLRLTPPLIFLMRKVMKDITCMDYTIPAGHIVFSSPAAACRLPDYWENPDSYDPMRHLDGRNEEDRQPYTNVSFGGGMHGCMGQQYAYIQVKIVLSIFFRQFKVEMLDKKFPKQDFACLVVPPVGDTLARLTRKVSK
ncbi:obtusifoliol 14-alpha demethylase, partial [Thraustotheca clavata]